MIYLIILSILFTIALMFGRPITIQKLSTFGSVIGGTAGIISLEQNISQNERNKVYHKQNNSYLIKYFDKEIYPLMYKINKRYYIANNLKNSICKENLDKIDLKIAKSIYYSNKIDINYNKDIIPQLYAISIPEFYKIEHWSRFYLFREYFNDINNFAKLEYKRPFLKFMDKYYYSIIMKDPHGVYTMFCRKLYYNLKNNIQAFE